MLTPTVAGGLIGYCTLRMLTTRAAPRVTHRSLCSPPASKKHQLYSSIGRPRGYPPAWVFGPVWTLLYASMGYASYRATIAGLYSPSSSVRHLAHLSQSLYTVQLAANLAWMPLFFGFRKPFAALMDIVLLTGMVLGLTWNYSHIDTVAAWLLVPYAAWLGYATYLNYGTGYLNQWDISDATVEKRKGKEREKADNDG